MREFKNLLELKNKAEKQLFIKENREVLIKQKKLLFKSEIEYKFRDEMYIKPSFDVNSINLENDEVLAVGNTVGFFDSHKDVSIKGSWTKTSNERGDLIPIMYDHLYRVNNMFAENKGSMIMEMPIRSLGYDKDGDTEVIAFKIKPFLEVDLMKYKTYTIKQHSMGLQYINLEFAVNNPEDEEGYRQWQKFIESVINREDVEENGYFWPILQQRAVEMSAVVFASNSLTPGFTTNTMEPKSTEINQPSKHIDTGEISRKKYKIGMLNQL